MSSSKDSNMTSPRGESSRKQSNSRQQTESLRSHKFSEGGLSCTSDCLFCGEGFQKNQNGQFEDMINKALYSKYSSSQNYYYTKDINDILAESRTAAVILFKDYLHEDEEEEYLKRFYFYSEYDFKIRMLAEYYKFHNDIARIFILPVINVVNRFHDKKRRLEYIRVTKMLKEEQEQQNPEAKTKAAEEKEEKKNYSITDRVLADLDLTNPDQRNEKRAAKVSKTNQEDKTQSKKKFIEKHKLIYKTGASTKMSELNQNNNKGGNQSRDMSASNTIHDLHLKLGEIISNSRSYNLDTNYLDNNEPQPNETMSNLSNFLLYLNKTSSVSNNTEIPKPEIGFSSSTLLSSALLTERPYRPELTQTSTRTKQSFKGDLTARISDSLVKALSPTSAKTASKMVRPPEKIKVKVEERPSGAPVLMKKKSQSESESERSKKIAGITKIKNFEEALKMNLQNSQQKGSTQNSASRDQGQEKYSSNGTLKSANRVSISRTPSKKVIEKPYESSRQQSQPFLSNTSRPSSRTKTRSTDMYSKALDLLLGSNQILLGTQTQKRETMVQGHRSTKSSFNFKIKTPSHQIQTQNERSLGRDDLKLSSGFTDISNRIVSHKLASDRLYLQTEREIKKMGTFGSLNIPQRETKQAPLSDREMRRDYMPKEKEPSKSHVKGMKAVLIMPNETEMSRSGFNSSQVEQRKIGLHKHAKSESRMKKIEGTEKIEIINDVKALLNGSGRSKGIDHSPRRQTFIQNQNNIINVFVNSTQDRKLERNLTLKTERQGYPEGIYQGEFDSLSRIFKSRSPNAEVLIKFNQSVPKRTSQAKNDSDYKNSDFSPMRVKQKDPANANLMRASSDKSPLSYNVAFQRRPGGKNEFETLRKDLRFDHFEMSGRSKEKS